MKSKIRYIPQHKNGHFITVRCEPTKDETAAVRFGTPEEVSAFLHGYYGPENPDDYKPTALKITYQLEVTPHGCTGDHEASTGTVSPGGH
ncbi:hypothetical protein [Gorillibacterium sp. sgz5001074]|uniref:hypothetical protein n=1 Tax=Gorillibacterium sp. sgz5001074 TaxID=3446695 RepID=UPI003F676F6F